MPCCGHSVGIINRTDQLQPSRYRPSPKKYQSNQWMDIEAAGKSSILIFHLIVTHIHNTLHDLILCPTSPRDQIPQHTLLLYPSNPNNLPPCPPNSFLLGLLHCPRHSQNPKYTSPFPASVRPLLRCIAVCGGDMRHICKSGPDKAEGCAGAAEDCS